MPNQNPLNSPETEMVDVTIVLDVSSPVEVSAAITELKAAGLDVVNIDDINGIVEGTIQGQKLAALKQVHRVKDIRLDFEYMAKQDSGAGTDDPQDGEAIEPQ